jgi:hypothetical protein
VRIAITLALAACSAPPAPVPLASSVPTTGSRSCALPQPRRSPAKVALRKWLGRIGDRSWVIVARGDQPALAGLAADGSLALVDLPVKRDQMIEHAIDGSRLWLMVGEQGLGVGEEILYAIDLGGAAPRIHRVEELAAKTIAGANSFAIGETRALFFTFAAQGGFQFWDRTKRVPLHTEKQPMVGLDPPPMRCLGARCFAATVVGDGPTRRLTSIRFADTKIEKQELASDHLGEHLLVPDGERTIVLWDSYSRTGLFARTLDAEGRPLDDEVTLVATRARDAQALHGGYIAYRSDDDWMLAQLSADHREVKRSVALGIPKASWLESAKTSDGVFLVGFTTAVSYHGEAIPPSTALAVYVAEGDAPDRPIDVMGADKRYGFTAFPLVAPGYAAALVISQNDEPERGELVLLRTPCAR